LGFVAPPLNRNLVFVDFAGMARWGHLKDRCPPKTVAGKASG
jgi:hypothetical protein